MNQENAASRCINIIWQERVEHALIYLELSGLGWARLGSAGVIAAGFGVQTDSGQRLKKAQIRIICLASFRVNRLDDVICDTCYKAICCMGRRSRDGAFRLGDFASGISCHDGEKRVEGSSAFHISRLSMYRCDLRLVQLRYSSG